MKIQGLLGILLLAGSGYTVGCVSTGEERLPDGVTYATTGASTASATDPNGGSTGTGSSGGNSNSGGTGGTGGTTGNPNTGNPNTADPNAGNPNTPPPPAPIPGMTLTARLNMARCVDIYGGRTAAGTSVDLFDCNGVAAAQLWQFVHGQLRATGDRCLDLPTAAQVGTPLIINPCDDKLPASQQWTLEAGSIKSNAASPTLCVALHYGALDNGTVLELATCAANNDAQHWGGNDTGTSVKGIYVVSVAAADHCLVVAGDGTVTWDVCTAASASTWTVDGSSKGTALMNGGNCLTAQDTALAMAACTGAADQQFSIAQGALRTPDGTRCVGAVPPASKSSVPATMAPCNNGDMGQQWSLGGLGQP